MSSEKEKSYLLTAAIDFGTTYSGYAYSYQDETKIHVNSNWKEGSQSYKTPTAVLFDENEKFVAFGHRAEDKYTDLADDEREHQYYFFHRFKMELYNEKNLNKDFSLVSKNGKKMRALDVISKCIDFLKQNLLNSLNSSQKLTAISSKQIKWVLTVPAIWNDKGKLFMKEAAIQAGIAKEDLIIALEPECASIFCRTLSPGGLPEPFSKVGSKYMVIDIGAIDFGTTYSGYAYSHQDEKNIHVNANWKEGSQSFKVSTAVLFDDRKNFIGFGFDAEEKYTDLSEDVREYQYYFFHRFKMELYNEKNLTKEFFLTSKNGRKMLALDVISKCIEYLKKSLLDSLNSSQNLAISAQQIKWVLTVPAIWSDRGKLFMKDAAVKAGIAEEDLLIALEPECASVFCKTLATGNLPQLVSKLGSKYMVVDLGGGTVDITFHETLANNNIKEISTATGNDGGGTNVDRKFEEFLGKILTENVVKYAKDKYPAEWLELERTFESVKRSIRSEKSNEYVSINVSSCLDDAYEAYNEMTIAEAFKTGDIKYPGVAMQGKRRMKIIQKEIQSMISDVCTIILHPIKIALRSPIDIDYVILAGGFSNSDIVRAKIKTFFYPIPVICLEEAELAVVRGAVLFGLRPTQIKSRVCRRTYGLSVARHFQPGFHPEKLAILTDDNVYYCDKIFDKLIRCGEKVDIGNSVTRTYCPAYVNQTEMALELYSSAKSEVKYCDEEDVTLLGKLIVQMPDKTGLKGRNVEINIQFGCTTIEIDAKDVNTGNKFNKTFDFLTS